MPPRCHDSSLEAVGHQGHGAKWERRDSGFEKSTFFYTGGKQEVPLVIVRWSPPQPDLQELQK